MFYCFFIFNKGTEVNKFFVNKIYAISNTEYTLP